MLALPGSAYLYQGEELGLEQVDVHAEHRQDPCWFRTGEPGRDGCRVPIPWGGDRAPYEFGPGTAQPWIPQPADWADRTVEAQTVDPESTLAFYRRALAARRNVRDHRRRHGRSCSTPGPTCCRSAAARSPSVLNCGATPVELPEGELLLASGPLAGDRLPADTAVWLR